MFSESESEDDNDAQLTINEHYAKAFAYKKEREELAKLKEKYGSDAEEDDEESEDSEEAESEDEDGEELTPAMDAAILRTLARIKRRDPEIYDANKGIFEEEQHHVSTQPTLKKAFKDKSKPVHMRELALKSALEDAASRSTSPEPAPTTHVQEQEALRNETIQAFHGSVKPRPYDAEGNEDDFLVPREKTKDEVEEEEEEYRQFLEREVGEDITGLVTIEEQDVGQDGDEEDRPAKEEFSVTVPKKKKKKSKERQKESDQEFLMNYILNRGWIDKSQRHVPTYSEVTGASHRGKDKGEVKQEDEDEAGNANEDFDDEEFVEVAETFESSYNFRFEEPNATVIQTHPRNIDSLVRRQDSARKEARERKKQRKEEKLLQKREEIKRLKALKMKELRQKLERVGREGGKDIEDEALADLDLDGDWDPDAHDKQMASLYGNDGEDDDTVEGIDLEKPIWDDDIDIGDLEPPEASTSSVKKKEKKKKRKHDEDGVEDGVDVDLMDADIEHPYDEEEWDGTEEMRKRKLEEYFDEISGLDFNDMVGDIPTRFKYMPVLPQSYGLKPTEILVAHDKELNEYMGVKKIAPYRKGNNWDPKRGEKLQALKERLKDRGVGGANTDDRSGERPVKKRKGKKEREREKAKATATAVIEENGHSDGDVGGGEADAEADADQREHEGPTKKKRRRTKKTSAVES